jgi:hypothetical protein
MTEEDKVIQAAREGLAEGFTTMTPEMERLLRLVYRAGYKQAKIDLFLESQEKEIKSKLGYSRVGLDNV